MNYTTPVLNKTSLAGALDVNRDHCKFDGSVLLGCRDL